MKNRITTFWKPRLPILATIAASIVAGQFCSAASTGGRSVLQPAEVVGPAAKTDKAQFAASNLQKKTKSADAAVSKAKAAAKRQAAEVQNRALVQRAVVNPRVEQQIRTQLEPLLKAELSFANRTAGLNDDERRKLITDSKKWFDEFVGPFVKHQDPNQQQVLLQGGNGVWFGGNAPNRDDPRKMIQTAVAKIVSDTLPKEKRDKYNDECHKREAFVRSVTVDNLVARVDERVILSSDQRKKITDSLIKHWDESSPPQLEAFAISSTIWPGIPNQWVLPELTEPQKSVLNRINRTSGRVVMGGMAFGLGADVIDDIGFDEAAPPLETKKSDR